MPFVQVPAGRGRAYDTNYVGFSAVTDKSHGGTALCIYLGGTVVAEIGWGERHQRVNVLEGIDVDANTFMLEGTKGHSGYALTSNEGTTSRSIRVSMSKLQHYVVMGPHRFTPTEFSIDKQYGVLVQLPAWLRYKHQQAPVENPFPMVTNPVVQSALRKVK